MNPLFEYLPLIFGITAGLLLNNSKNPLPFLAAACLAGFLCNRLSGEPLSLSVVDMAVAAISMIVVRALKQRLVRV